MKHVGVFGGIFYYGFERIESEYRIGGKKVETPRWFGGIGKNALGIYRHRRLRKNEKRFLVLNYTHPYFAAGSSTSGGFGLVAKWTELAKRGGAQDGDTHRQYRGLFAQVGLQWFKVYLYVYPAGDGFR